MKNHNQTDTPSLSQATRFMRDEFVLAWRKIIKTRPAVAPLSPEVLQIVQQVPTACLVARTGPATLTVHATGTELTSSLLGNAGRDSLASLFRKSSTETIMELIEAAFVFPAELSMPLVSDGNPWRKPIQGELSVLPLIGQEGTAQFALILLSVDTKRALKGLTFEIKREEGFTLSRIPMPKSMKRPTKGGGPRLVVSNA